jgi:hypothetical protein
MWAASPLLLKKAISFKPATYTGDDS